MSRDERLVVDFLGKTKESVDLDFGLCLNCSHKLTLCGKPFTADVICVKCNYMNHFVSSKQPVHARPMDSCVSA